jgi:hypothetical protein
MLFLRWQSVVDFMVLTVAVGHQRTHKETVQAVFGDDPETTTTKAPVGPPICVFDPPRKEIRKPATMAQ